MDVDAGTEPRAGCVLAPALTPLKPQPMAEPLPESEIYLRLLILYNILDIASGLPSDKAGVARLAANNAQELYLKAISLAHETVEQMLFFNRRSLDPMAAKVWFAIGRAYELGGNLSELRPCVSHRESIIFFLKNAFTTAFF